MGTWADGHWAPFCYAASVRTRTCGTVWDGGCRPRSSKRKLSLALGTRMCCAMQRATGDAGAGVGAGAGAGAGVVFCACAETEARLAALVWNLPLIPSQTCCQPAAPLPTSRLPTQHPFATAPTARTPPTRRTPPSSAFSTDPNHVETIATPSGGLHGAR
jgi:hypothetical protein